MIRKGWTGGIQEVVDTQTAVPDEVSKPIDFAVPRVNPDELQPWEGSGTTVEGSVKGGITKAPPW